MKELKLLHISDMHFDRTFSHLSQESAALRKSEVLINFKNVIDKFNDVDIVLIPGDMFDGEVSFETCQFIHSVFKKHSDKFFFISLGNHDSFSNANIETFTENLPDNVKVFGDKIEKISLDEYDTDIYGVSFSSEYSYASLIKNFSADNPDKINILVVHGDIGGDSDYNPMSVSDLAFSKVDYAALGHIHKFDGIHKTSGTYYAYSGVFEPGGFDETGECGVIAGKVTKLNSELKFYPVSLRQYHVLNVDISDFSSNEEIIGHINNVVNPEFLYKIILSGERNCAKPPKEVYERLINCFYMEIEDLCKSTDSVLNYTDEFSLRGKTACELMKHKDCDERVYKAAHDILTRLMCGDSNDT